LPNVDANDRRPITFKTDYADKIDRTLRYTTDIGKKRAKPFDFSSPTERRI
jgi:hypothetical protein